MNPQELSAQELVQLCLDNNQQAAWEEFVRRYQPGIACAVRQALWKGTRPRPALVDDLVQETYIKVIANNSRALRAFDFRDGDEPALRGFLSRIAHNLVTDHLRGAKNKKRWNGQDDLNLDDVELYATEFRNSAERADHDILVNEIDVSLKRHLENDANAERDYMVFWLYFEQGYTAKQIAELLGGDLTIKGVESCLLRLATQLRSKLSRAARQ